MTITKIMERTEEFYTELFDNEQSTIIHIDLKEVPEITSWEVEVAINIDSLKAGEDTISRIC